MLKFTNILKQILICTALAIIAIAGWFLIGFNPFTGKTMVSKELVWGITVDHILWILIILGLFYAAFIIFWYIKYWMQGYYR